MKREFLKNKHTILDYNLKKKWREAFNSNAINKRGNEWSLIDSRLPSYFCDISFYIMYA